MSADWRSVALSARAKRDSAIPAAWRADPAEVRSLNPLHAVPWIESKLSKRELEITAMTAAEAAAKIARGELTSVEITEAICHRAALSHAVTNCLTEVFFDEALARARELDAHLARSGKPLGPLHGLPVSIKDEFDMPGKLTTWGFVAWAMDGPANQTASVPKMLLDAGAVLYAKTNVPQGLMTWESDNPLWDHTRNPANLTLGSGGSSGGEGALVAAGGSFLGVGTDIGGSIRLPAAINGVFGLKPSSRRFPYCGSRTLQSSVPDSIKPVQGPIARSTADVELYCRVFATEEGGKVDPECLGVGWRRAPGPGKGRKMKFGYFTETEYFRPVAPVVRAVDEAVEALRKRGHEVVEFPITDLKTVYMASAFFFSAYPDEVHATLKRSGEPLVPGLEGYYSERPVKTEAGMKKIVDNFRIRDEARAAFLERFNAAGLDGIVCPAVGVPSCKHKDANRLGKAASLATYWNMLDVAVGVVPVTKVLLSDAAWPKNSKYRNYTEQVLQEAYTPEDFLNCPVSVQVVGRRWGEEGVVEMMYELEAALKADPKYRTASL